MSSSPIWLAIWLQLMMLLVFEIDDKNLPKE